MRLDAPPTASARPRRGQGRSGRRRPAGSCRTVRRYGSRRPERWGRTGPRNLRRNAVPAPEAAVPACPRPPPWGQAGTDRRSRRQDPPGSAHPSDPLPRPVAAKAARSASRSLERDPIPRRSHPASRLPSLPPARCRTDRPGSREMRRSRRSAAAELHPSRPWHDGAAVPARAGRAAAEPRRVRVPRPHDRVPPARIAAPWPRLSPSWSGTERPGRRGSADRCRPPARARPTPARGRRGRRWRRGRADRPGATDRPACNPSPRAGRRRCRAWRGTRRAGRRSRVVRATTAFRWGPADVRCRGTSPGCARRRSATTTRIGPSCHLRAGRPHHTCPNRNVRLRNEIRP